MIPSPPLLPSAQLLKAGMLWRSCTAATAKTPAAGCVPDIRTNYSKAATPIWTKSFLNWTASFAQRLFRTNRPAHTLKDEITWRGDFERNGFHDNAGSDTRVNFGGANQPKKAGAEGAGRCRDSL